MRREGYDQRSLGTLDATQRGPACLVRGQTNRPRMAPNMPPGTAALIGDKMATRKIGGGALHYEYTTSTLLLRHGAAGGRPTRTNLEVFWKGGFWLAPLHWNRSPRRDDGMKCKA